MNIIFKNDVKNQKIYSNINIYLWWIGISLYRLEKNENT